MNALHPDSAAIVVAVGDEALRAEAIHAAAATSHDVLTVTDPRDVPRSLPGAFAVLVDSLMARVVAAAQRPHTAPVPVLFLAADPGPIDYEAALACHAESAFIIPAQVKELLAGIAAAGTPQASKVRELRGEALGPVVGAFEKTSLDNHDYSLIGIDDPARPRFENNLVRVPGQAPVAIDGVAQPVVGAPVCKSGARTGFSCGTVNSVGQSVQVGDRTLNDAFSTTICALPGDSGGAIITGTKALGISSASSVADQPICAIPEILGAITGDTPILFATTLNVVLAENPGLKVRTS